MTTPAPLDWHRLAPHRPLDAGASEYVARPVDGGESISRWVLAGGTTVLVGGPTGVGKSTEVAQAALRLSADRVACLIQVDRLTNVRRLTADELLQLIGGRVFAMAVETLGLSPSHPLAANFTRTTSSTGSHGFRASSPTVTRLLLDELVMRDGFAKFKESPESPRDGRVTLVIDGLEKLSPGVATDEIFDALGGLPGDVDLVVVVPWHAAFGSRGDTVLRQGERYFAIHPLATDGQAGVLAADFLGRVLARRLTGTVDTLPPELHRLLGRAFKASGGIPRGFLQILADAGTYARVRRGAALPDETDLDEALNDQRESLRRLLIPGDEAAIKRVAGTDGRELEPERKVRLLSHGILLERLGADGPQLEAHPLAPLAA